MHDSSDHPTRGASSSSPPDAPPQTRQLGSQKSGRAASSGPERKKTADIHILRPFAPGSDESIVQFSFQIENFPHIQYAYGSVVGLEALDGVRRIASDIIGSDGTVLVDANGALRILVRDPASLGGGVLSDACQRLVEAFCEALPMVALHTSAGPICLWVSGAWSISNRPAADGTQTSSETGGTSLRFAGGSPQEDAAWADRYRADMALVVTVMTALERAFAGHAEQLALFWQPVCDGERVLYREALVRFIDANGVARSPADEILALERLGFIRFLDRYVVARVVAELEDSSNVSLGVNISAQSVRGDCWWDDVVHRLNRRNDVANRLILEITETTTFPNMSEAVRFTARMRRLGCKVALDDFGMGFTSVRQILALSPDIVKLDRFFLRRAGLSAKDRATFLHLAQFAQSMDVTVVVEGVETQSQAKLVHEAGVRWQQGYYWGRPTTSRAWLAQAFDTAPAARISDGSPIAGADTVPSSVEVGL